MLLDDVERTIRTTPGLTATQIARELFGDDGYGERVRSVCQTLHKLGRVERTGKGGPGDPFRFYPAGAAAASNSMSGKASSLSLGEIVIGRTTAGRMKYLNGQLIRSPLAE